MTWRFPDEWCKSHRILLDFLILRNQLLKNLSTRVALCTRLLLADPANHRVKVVLGCNRDIPCMKKLDNVKSNTAITHLYNTSFFRQIKNLKSSGLSSYLEDQQRWTEFSFIAKKIIYKSYFLPTLPGRIIQELICLLIRGLVCGFSCELQRLICDSLQSVYVDIYIHYTSTNLVVTHSNQFM